MDFLNYHHLLYFWMTAREGSIVKAAERLHLSQPTISAQLRMLERAVGSKLLVKSGRSLQLTEMGRTVLGYADEIFNLGRELQDMLRGTPLGKTLRFTVGVPDVLPKLIVFRLLRPAFELPEKIQLICREGTHEELMVQLASHELDLVLSDAPASGNANVRVFNHLLGKCGISFFASPELAKKHKQDFPESLQNAPLLLPPGGTVSRRMLDQWFDEQQIHPRVQAEFQDSALLKVFGQEGLGIFPAPAVLREEIERQYRVKLVGTIEDLQESFYAISAERRLKHPAVLKISQAAKSELF
jgi:LysR family transcriptional regulator, transcriptional activator of nhaA